MDVLVAGAGPVGLFAAHSFASKGLSVGIVDTGTWACSHSYALALHPATIDLLCKAGLANDILSSAHQLRTLAVYDESRQRARIEFESSRPMAVLPQSLLETGLEKALNEAGVEVKWRHKVSLIEPAGDHVRVTLNRYEKESRGYVVARTEWALTKTWTVEVPWVIGTDGYDSVVRRSLGLTFPEFGPATYYAVFEFQSDAAIEDEVRISCGDQTMDVLWPLGGGWFRWSFELPDHIDPVSDRFASVRARYGDPSDRFKDRSQHGDGDVHLLPDDRLSKLIAERAPWFRGGIEDIGWRTIVRFEKRLAECYGSNRCWLAGDAAHIGAPLSVQSLNAGIAEVQCLSEILASGGSAQALYDYGITHMKKWKLNQSSAEALPFVDPWVWERRERLLPCLPGYGSSLTTLAAQIGLRIPAV